MRRVPNHLGQAVVVAETAWHGALLYIIKLVYVSWLQQVIDAMAAKLPVQLSAQACLYCCVC